MYFFFEKCNGAKNVYFKAQENQRLFAIDIK